MTEAIASKADAATLLGSAISVGSASKHYLGLTLDEWSLLGIFFGMAMALAGYLTSLYFKSEHLKIAQRTAQADPDE